MSAVFSAFTLAYSLFEMPSGWLGDVMGPRRVLTRIVLWWSAFTMLTGAAQGLQSLVAIRFLFGAGEAGAFPNIVAQLLAVVPGARARHGQRRACSSARASAGHADGADCAAARSALGLARQLRRLRGGRASSGRSRGTGRIAIGREDHRRRSRGARVDSAGSPARNSPTANCQRRGRRRGGGCSPAANLYAICAMYFTFGYGLYFYFTWLPTYLISELRLLTARRRVLLVAAVSARWRSPISPAAGAPTRWRGRAACATARVTLGFAAFLTVRAADPGVYRRAFSGRQGSAAGAGAGVGRFCPQRVLGVCLDVAPDHAGVVTGFMNTFGNLGGLIGPLVVGLMVDRLGSWTLPFYVTAGVYFAGALAWLAINPNRRLA